MLGGGAATGPGAAAARGGLKAARAFAPSSRSSPPAARPGASSSSSTTGAAAGACATGARSCASSVSASRNAVAPGGASSIVRAPVPAARSRGCAAAAKYGSSWGATLSHTGCPGADAAAPTVNGARHVSCRTSTASQLTSGTCTTAIAVACTGCQGVDAAVQPLVLLGFIGTAGWPAIRCAGEAPCLATSALLTGGTSKGAAAVACASSPDSGAAPPAATPGSSWRAPPKPVHQDSAGAVAALRAQAVRGVAAAGRAGGHGTPQGLPAAAPKSQSACECCWCGCNW